MNYLNKRMDEALSQSLKKDNLTHAYIVYGGDKEYRRVYINNFVKRIFCVNGDDAPCDKCSNCIKIDNNNFEDLIYVEKEGNSIKVNQIKKLNSSLTNKPFGLRTVAIINDADHMTPESQNKILKTLEEPSPGTIIILSVTNLFSLYPTVRSRCVTINSGVISSYNNSTFREQATNVVKYSISNKPLHTIFEEVNNCVSTSTEATDFLDIMERFLRDVIVGRYSSDLLFERENIDIVNRIDWSKGYPFREYIKLIEEAKENIRKNISWKYTIKNLLISFKQEESHG